jgi:Protein of unknown function (DUF669)
MIKYEVMTEEQVEGARFDLLPEGEYNAVIVRSEDRQSSSGNPMMDMTLDVYDFEGRTHTVRDFLVFTKPMMWKVLHCAQSADVLPEYQQQRFCSNTVINKGVKVKIGIEEGRLIPEDKLKDKPPGSKYPSKNKVLDYLKRTTQDKISEYVNKYEVDDEDVPF